ncbi:molybdopterin-dependent oxidoreductase [Nitratireductor basaltis]|nr:molybdopterin-dependent oxidoreductase [Nitratireductor basaltis]
MFLPTGRRVQALAMALFAVAASQAYSQDATLSKPEGKTILTIEGEISVTNSGSEAVFDRAMLEELGVKTVKTTTPWYDGDVTFEGVPMRVLLERVGSEGEELVARALNDYSTVIPISDFYDHDVILALKRDGEYMEISDKGPLFIVYPYDGENLHSQQYYARSAWQVARLVVR